MTLAEEGLLLRVKMLINMLSKKILKLDLMIISRKAIGSKINNPCKVEINTHLLVKHKLIITMEPVEIPWKVQEPTDMMRLSIKLVATQAKTTLVVIMTVQNTMKPITTKQEKEAPSLTSPSTWPKRETKTLLQVMEIKTTTEALSRMSLMQFSHTCLKALLRMWMIITISTIKTLINSNPTKTMVIKFHINKINSLI